MLRLFFITRQTDFEKIPILFLKCIPFLGSLDKRQDNNHTWIYLCCNNDCHIKNKPGREKKALVNLLKIKLFWVMSYVAQKQRHSVTNVVPEKSGRTAGTGRTIITIAAPRSYERKFVSEPTQIWIKDPYHSERQIKFLLCLLQIIQILFDSFAIVLNKLST